MPSQGLGDPLHEPGILSIALGISIQGSSIQKALESTLVIARYLQHLPWLNEALGWRHVVARRRR